VKIYLVVTSSIKYLGDQIVRTREGVHKNARRRKIAEVMGMGSAGSDFSDYEIALG